MNETGSVARGPAIAQGAVRRGSSVVSVVIPRDPQTRAIIRGDIREQSRRVFESLQQSLAEVGCTPQDLMLVQVFLIDSDDWAGMNEVWNQFFAAPPYPERATIIAKQLAVPGMRIEIVAFGHVGAS